MLAADVRLSGTIESDGEVHIDGIVNGDVVAERLTIGPDAAVIGRLRAREIWVGGTVHGEIAADALTIAASGRVYADLYCVNVAIEPGAAVEPRGQPPV